MSDFTPNSTKLEESATYSQSKDGSHVFKGSEQAVLKCIADMGLRVDYEPKFHLATGKRLSGDMRSVLTESGGEVAFFLTPTTDSTQFSLVMDRKFKHEFLEQFTKTEGAMQS